MGASQITFHCGNFALLKEKMMDVQRNNFLRKVLCHDEEIGRRSETSVNILTVNRKMKNSLSYSIEK